MLFYLISVYYHVHSILSSTFFIFIFISLNYFHIIIIVYTFSIFRTFHTFYLFHIPYVFYVSRIFRISYIFYTPAYFTCSAYFTHFTFFTRSTYSYTQSQASPKISIIEMMTYMSKNAPSPNGNEAKKLFYFFVQMIAFSVQNIYNSIKEERR